MTPRTIRTLTLLTVGATLLLSACSTSAPQTAVLGALASTAPEKVKMAEASGARGTWISGSRGAWVKSVQASTVPGVTNTFQENQVAWKQIHLPQAQALTPHLGTNVTVAVIDTGLDLTHPAFAGKLTDPGTWRDWVDGDRLPNDDGSYQDSSMVGYGHGTDVASLIAQVAPNARLLPLRVLAPDGSGRVADVVAAIDYAVSAGANVINLSVGTDNSSDVDQAVMNATTRGVYVIAASGNTGDKKVTAPARYATSNDTQGLRSLSVGSVNASDQKSGFSTYGSKLEVLAPGEHLLGAAPQGLVEAWSGTSMAAPIATGVVTLALGELAAGRTSRWAGKVTDALASTADSIEAVNDPQLAGQLGTGRINAETFITTVLAR